MVHSFKHSTISNVNGFLEQYVTAYLKIYIYGYPHIWFSVYAVTTV